MKQKILVFGGESMVGSRLLELYEDELEIEAPSLAQVDLLKVDQLTEAVKNSPASAVVNFAAFTNVGQAEEEKGNENGIAYKLNAKSVSDLAEVCKKTHKYFVQISTEYVFDGKKALGLNEEDDKPNPINWYGQTKLLGEKAVLESGCEFLIMRISMPYRSHFEPKKDIVRRFIEMLQTGQEIRGITDVVNTPVFIDDIAHALFLLLGKRPQGIMHVAAADAVSPYGFAQLIAKKFNFDQSLVKPISLEEYSQNSSAPLLKNSGLNTEKFRKEFGEGVLHTVEEGLEIFKKQFTSTD